MRGQFLVVDGCEGSGKSSNISAVKEFLESKGVKVHLTREPGGTPMAEEIREVVLKRRETEEVDPTTELLLMMAARNQHVEQLIKPLLKEGVWVLSDRFHSSSVAYQHAHGVDWDRIEALRQFALGDFKPDLTLLLDVPPEVSLARIDAGRGGATDRFEDEGVALYARVRDNYSRLAKEDPKHYRVIDANQSLEAVAGDITQAVGRHLDKVLSKQNQYEP